MITIKKALPWNCMEIRTVRLGNRVIVNTSAPMAGKEYILLDFPEGLKNIVSFQEKGSKIKFVNRKYYKNLERMINQ